MKAMLSRVGLNELLGGALKQHLNFYNEFSTARIALRIVWTSSSNCP